MSALPAVQRADFCMQWGIGVPRLGLVSLGLPYGGVGLGLHQNMFALPSLGWVVKCGDFYSFPN